MSSNNVKPSPSKRQKVEEEDEENVDVNVKEEAQDSLPFGKSGEEADGIDAGESLTRKKAPVPIRVGDIFHVTTLGPHHRPGGGDFIGSFPREINQDVIGRRQKQIEYGKSTTAYCKYLEAVPREERLPTHPRTPNMKRKYSRRAWDGLIRVWRLKLHVWDLSPEEAAKAIHSKNPNESFSSAGESASTASSVMDDQDPEVSFLSETEEIEQTVLEESKVNGHLEPLRASSPVVQPKKESSWYEDTLDFEAEYLDLYPERDEDLEFTVKQETV